MVQDISKLSETVPEMLNQSSDRFAAALMTSMESGSWATQPPGPAAPQPNAIWSEGPPVPLVTVVAEKAAVEDAAAICWSAGVGVIAVPTELDVVVHNSPRISIPLMVVRPAPFPVINADFTADERAVPGFVNAASLAVLAPALVVWFAPGTQV